MSPRPSHSAGFPDGTIAQAVFDAQPRPKPPAVEKARAVPPSGSFAAIVLGGSSRSAGSLLLGAAVLSLLVHALPMFLLAGTNPKEATSPAPRENRTPFERVVELPPRAQSPETSAARTPEPKSPITKVSASSKPPAAKSAPIAKDSANSKPPAPAATGAVVTAAATDAPVDFTGFDIVTGSATSFAGGTSASNGTSTVAVHASEVHRDGEPYTGEASRARTVGLSANNWQCAWPREAEALGIDEQVVILRAVVRADGRASSVEVLADPGHGFGAAALTCAEQARFDPALDPAGKPYAATSPPIRVTFTR